MGNNNSMSRSGFIWEHLFWIVVSMIWYKNILFRCIGTHTLVESKLILWGIVASSCITGIVFQIKNNRNGLCVFLNLMFGLGIYTALTYMQIQKTLIIVILSIVAVLSVAFTALVMFRKIKNKHNASKIIRRRMVRSLTGSRQLLALGCTFIVFISGAGAILGSSLVNASVKPLTQKNSDEQTIANNIETLRLLHDELWDTITVQQKLDVLQTVANIEQRYLGLPNELNVGAANLEEGVLAYYSDNTHEIIVSMDSLLYNSSWELVDSICHEAFHSLEHRMVDAYNSADDELKSLRIFHQATSYANEFSNYINGDEDFCGYYFQDCESDARDYAEQAVCDYYIKINDYILNRVD